MYVQPCDSCVKSVKPFSLNHRWQIHSLFLYLTCIQAHDLKFADSTLFSAPFVKVSRQEITSSTQKIIFFA